jgi:NitT/TauT family transport system ATP-binding protein
VLFITHDLDEAIAMSDRVVVLSAGPASHPIGEFTIDLPRPRDVAEVRTTPRFIELHNAIWAVLRDEVLKGYAQQLVKAACMKHLRLYQLACCWRGRSSGT